MPHADAELPQPADWRAFLSRALPDHLVPAQVVPLARLPLGTTGKLDRRALPEPVWAAPAAHGDREPGSETEKILAAIWSEVLGVPDVHADDNYFALGGDSILGIQLVSAARRAGLALTPRHLFTHQTLAELALAAEQAQNTENTENTKNAGDTKNARDSAEQGAVVGEAPLTPVQHWMFAELGADTRFAQAVSYHLAPDVDETLLRAALGAVLEQHDALRQRYEPAGPGQWRQYGTAPDGGTGTRHLRSGG